MDPPQHERPPPGGGGIRHTTRGADGCNIHTHAFPWKVSGDQFRARGSREQKWGHLLLRASLSAQPPSTQPWPQH